MDLVSFNPEYSCISNICEHVETLLLCATYVKRLIPENSKRDLIWFSEDSVRIKAGKGKKYEVVLCVYIMAMCGTASILTL